MFSSGNAAHRRRCSRREPSQVVRLQSISEGESLSRIVVDSNLEVLNVDEVLRPPRFLVHYS